MIVTVSSLNSFKVMAGTWAMHLALFFGLYFGVKDPPEIEIKYKGDRSVTF